MNWLVELDGIYLQRSKIGGVINTNTGGNSLILGPSLWFSTPRFLTHIGLSGFVIDNLFGSQHKEKYLFAVGAGWTF